MKQYASNDQTYTMVRIWVVRFWKNQRITLAKHTEGHSVSILHDDAFVISRKKWFCYCLGTFLL